MNPSYSSADDAQQLGVASAQLLDAALEYAELGYPIVPIRAGTKQPSINTGRGHAEHASRDPEVIRRWHRQGLLGGIATPTGAPSGVIVIEYERDTEHVYNEFCDRLGPLPRTRVVRSRNGGRHVHLRYPGVNVRTRQSVLGVTGIEVKGDLGKIMLPPSDGYLWLTQGELRDVPPKWLDVITYEPPSKYVAKPVDIDVSEEHKLRRARAYLARLPASVSGSGGHDALFIAAVALRWGFELPESTVEWLLMSEFNPRCEPPWDAEEVHHKTTDTRRSSKRACSGYLLEQRSK